MHPASVSGSRGHRAAGGLGQRTPRVADARWEPLPAAQSGHEGRRRFPRAWSILAPRRSWKDCDGGEERARHSCFSGLIARPRSRISASLRPASKEHTKPPLRHLTAPAASRLGLQVRGQAQIAPAGHGGRLACPSRPVDATASVWTPTAPQRTPRREAQLHSGRSRRLPASQDFELLIQSC